MAAITAQRKGMSRNRHPARGPARTVVTARGPADLVAAVPYLVGFVPSASVVVVSLRGPRLRLGLVARLDLPEGRYEADAARSLGEFVRRDGPREVVVLIYDERTWEPSHRPGQALVDAVEDEFANHHIPVREAVYVTSQRFFSYLCHSPVCCPESGTPLSETASSEVAATYVLQGRSPLAGRQSLADRVAPGAPITIAAVGTVLDSVVSAARAWWQSPEDPAWLSWQRDVVAAFDVVARRYADGGRPVSPDEAGRLLAGLLDSTVRDVVATRWTRWWLAFPPPTDLAHDELAGQVGRLAADGAVPDLEDQQVAEGVERLLVDLAVRTDGPAALAPLTLLAMQSWACGDGAQAGVAIDRVLGIDPAYRMAGLVDALLRSGMAPRWVADDRALDEGVSPRRPPDVPLTG